MTEFGYFLSGEENSAPELVRYAQSAEKAGFTKLWMSDHYHPWLTAQDESPFVWSVLGAIAATTDLHMTTAVTCPTFRIHPAIIAQATATVAALAPGRFTFGVGSGEALNEHILGDTWPPVDVRLERLEEAIGIIRALWSGELLTHAGTHYTVHNAKLHSLPDTLPEILVSGFGPKATELAARVGDGWITVQPDAEGLQTYRSSGGTGRTQAGLKICWAETEKEATETALKYWGHELIQGPPTVELPLWTGFDTLAEAGTPEKMAQEIACGPDPERAAEAIGEYVKAGFDEVYISQMGPDQEGGIRFIAEHVLPLL